MKVQKKNTAKVKTPYSATKNEVRNVLSNISYRYIKEKDLDNFSFISGLKYFSLFFFLDSKFNNENDRELILMLSQHCIQQSLHDYIKKPKNFEKL